jgi:hypothetical protein
VVHSSAGRLPAGHQTVHVGVKATHTCAFVCTAARSCDDGGGQTYTEAELGEELDLIEEQVRGGELLATAS